MDVRRQKPYCSVEHGRLQLCYGKKRCLFDMKIIGNPVSMIRISQDSAGPCGVLHVTKSDSRFSCGCELEFGIGVSQARQTITREADAQA